MAPQCAGSTPPPDVNWPKTMNVVLKPSPCEGCPFECPTCTEPAPQPESKVTVKKEERPSYGNKKKKRSRSLELRAGTVYRGCDCEKHNGLQDDCPRSGCHGSPDCTFVPAPICPNSEFSNHKHLKYKERSKRARFRYDVFSVLNHPADTSYYIVN